MDLIDDFLTRKKRYRCVLMFTIYVTLAATLFSFFVTVIARTVRDTHRFVSTVDERERNSESAE